MPEEKTSIFNTDPADETEGERLSLRAYIAEHIRKKTQETGSEPREIEVFNPYRQLLTPKMPSGSHINKLDVDFGEGLEHLLPTPVTRYKVIKSRLIGEIAAVQARLARYLAVPHPTAETEAQVTALKERLVVLERHHEEVSVALMQMYANGTAAIQVNLWHQGAVQWVSGVTSGIASELGRWLQQVGVGGHANEIRELCSQINEIQNVLAEELRRPGVSSGELSHLITESDHKMRELENRARQLREQGWKSRFLPDKTS